jgi:hypothetical protein
MVTSLSLFLFFFFFNFHGFSFPPSSCYLFKPVPDNVLKGRSDGELTMGPFEIIPQLIP